MRHSDSRWVEKIISSEDVDIEKAAENLANNISKKTLKIIRKSNVASLKPLLNQDPVIRLKHARKLVRQYWGLPEPTKV